jgi:hypothetical protein
MHSALLCSSGIKDYQASLLNPSGDALLQPDIQKDYGLKCKKSCVSVLIAAWHAGPDHVRGAGQKTANAVQRKS